MHQNLAVSKALSGKFWNQRSQLLIFNPANCCIPRRHRLFGQITWQPLSNSEPRNLENISNFQSWGLILVAYKKRISVFKHLAK